MAITASKLKALVEADVSSGVANLRVFSSELKRTATEADREAKAAGAAISNGMRQGTDQAARHVGGLLDTIKGIFGGYALWDITKGMFNGFVSGISNLVGGTLRDAFKSVMDFESLSMSITQLTATQLVQANVTDNMGEALQKAAGPAKELIGWVERLAVLSPFESADINSAIQMAMGFQFSQEEAKRLTQDMVDFVSAAGKSPDVLNRVVLSLGQIRMAGKVTGQDLRELANAGLPVTDILAKAFKVTTAEMVNMVSDGAVPATKAIRAIEEYLEKNFKGAAERTANTWQGLVSSLKEAKSINLRELFSGVFEALQPIASTITSTLLDPKFRETVRGIGKDLGDGVRAGIVTIQSLLTGLNNSGAFDNLKSMFSGITGSDGVNASNIIKAIILGIATAAVEVVAFGRQFYTAITGLTPIVIEFIDAFLVGMTLLSNKWAAFIDGVKWGGIAMQNAARGNFAGMIEAANQSKMAFEDSNLAASNFSDRMNAAQSRMAEYTVDMKNGLDDVAAARERDLAVVKEQGAVFDAQLERVKNPDKYFVGPKNKPAYSFMGQVTKEAEDPAVAAALKAALEATGGSAGTAAGKKAGENLNKELEKALGKAQSMLDKGMNFSIGLGKIGGGDEGAPGTDSWAEDIFRIQDVAMNLGTSHEGKDTRKYYQQFFDGMGFKEAQEQASRITRKFQSGLLMDPEVFQHLDIGKARDMIGMQMQGDDQRAAFAKLVGSTPDMLDMLIGKDAATGKSKKSPQELEAMMRVLKGDMVAGMQKVAGESPTVTDAMFGAVADSGQGGENKKGPDMSAFTTSFVGAMQKELVAKSAEYQGLGGLVWDQMEVGIIDKASKSGRLSEAVDKFVEASLAKRVPGYNGAGK